LTARRTYLVVIDETEECRTALRYAAQRAAHVGGALTLLHVIRPPDFVAFGAVHAAMREEGMVKGDALLARLSAEVEESSGLQAFPMLREGDVEQIVLEAIGEDRTIATLVLATSRKGAPGPLISFFTGEHAANLPCLITIVPGNLGDTELDSLT
jgi:nucleotide-binding universal stress UspA family protein